MSFCKKEILLEFFDKIKKENLGNHLDDHLSKYLQISFFIRKEHFTSENDCDLY